MVEIDLKMLKTKILKISASKVLHNKNIKIGWVGLSSKNQTIPMNQSEELFYFSSDWFIGIVSGSSDRFSHKEIVKIQA